MTVGNLRNSRLCWSVAVIAASFTLQALAVDAAEPDDDAQKASSATIAAATTAQAANAVESASAGQDASAGEAAAGAEAKTEEAAAAEPAKPAAPVRPEWLTEEEQHFLDTTGGLRPIATYDSDAGLVTIKLKKPGLTFDQIYEIAIGPTYDYYTRTDLVETSFRGKMDGKDYLFTGTIAKKYMLGGSVTIASVPVVTRFTQSRKDGRIKIEWNKPDEATAKRFLNENKDRLKTAMNGAGIDDDLEDYLEDIIDDLSDTKTIWGRHEYYADSGYYIYQQKAVMESAVANLIAGVAGEGDIKGAALKIGYQVLREPGMAGGPGSVGKEVVDYSGKEIEAGR